MAVGTVSSLGVGSGLDLQGMLDKLRQADQIPITRDQTQITTDQQRLAEYDTLNAKMLAMKQNALTLSLSSNYLNRSATVSNPSVATATAAPSAAQTTETFQVNRLATTSSWQSAGFATADSAFVTADTPFTLQVGTASPVSLTISANTSLSGVADLINKAADNPGVTATIINDGSASTPYRLVLTANATGEDHRISVSGISMTELVGAGAASLNAEVALNGITYQRQSNSNISDIIQGVSLNLAGTGSASVTVSSDTTSMHDNIIGMVTSYNDLVKEIQSKSSYDQTTQQWGLLASDVSIKSLPGTLNALMSTQIRGLGSIQSMYDLGMSINQDGTITIDQTVLDDAISTKPQDVQNFLLGDSSKSITGFADLINNQMTNLTQTSGLIDSQKTLTQNEIDRLNADIATSTQRLNAKYDAMTSQFVQLDRYISQMKSQASYLTSVFNSITPSATTASTTK
jgi:flagellar hook-associated protein 2